MSMCYELPLEMFTKNRADRRWDANLRRLFAKFLCDYFSLLLVGKVRYLRSRIKSVLSDKGNIFL